MIHTTSCAGRMEVFAGHSTSSSYLDGQSLFSFSFFRHTASVINRNDDGHRWNYLVAEVHHVVLQRGVRAEILFAVVVPAAAVECEAPVAGRRPVLPVQWARHRSPLPWTVSQKWKHFSLRRDTLTARDGQNKPQAGNKNDPKKKKLHKFHQLLFQGSYKKDSKVSSISTVENE